MGKKKRAAKIRKSDEFSPARLRRPPRPPALPSAAYSWTLETIMNARDAQIRGQFRTPVQLATSMRTDSALHVARRNRLAPLRCLGVAIKPGQGPRAGAIAGEGEALFGADGIALSRETVASINGDLADHGVAIGYNDWTPRPDGSRVDLVHHVWPLELVTWDAQQRQLYTLVEPGTEPNGGRSSLLQPIVHGDGTWVVYQAHELQPWRQDAAILACALVWAAHAFASRDWSRGSASHGNAKVIGELPAGTPLQDTDDDGNVSISTEASAFLDLLEDVAGLDVPVGIRPTGAQVEYLMNTSRAWEVWERLITATERAAARMYLGTDGTLGSMGGAPGVDIAELFGVATTVIQGDITAIESGIRTGIIEPWGAVNFGDSAAVPSRKYLITDPDEQRVREEEQKRRDETAKNEAAFCAAVSARRGAGFEVTQQWADKLADELGVERLQLAATQSSGIVLAPTDVAKIVRVNEGRASIGLPAADEDKWIAEVGVEQPRPVEGETADPAAHGSNGQSVPAAN